MDPGLLSAADGSGYARGLASPNGSQAATDRGDVHGAPQGQGKSPRKCAQREWLRAPPHRAAEDKVFAGGWH